MPAKQRHAQDNENLVHLNHLPDWHNLAVQRQVVQQQHNDGSPPLIQPRSCPLERNQQWFFGSTVRHQRPFVDLPSPTPVVAHGLSDQELSACPIERAADNLGR